MKIDAIRNQDSLCPVMVAALAGGSLKEETLDVASYMLVRKSKSHQRHFSSSKTGTAMAVPVAPALRAVV